MQAFSPQTWDDQAIALTGQTTVKNQNMQMGQISATIQFVSLMPEKKDFLKKASPWDHGGRQIQTIRYILIVPLLDKGFGTPIIVTCFIQPAFAKKYY